MKAEKYVAEKAAQAYRLSRMLEQNMEDFMDKAAEGYPEDVRAMARCDLGRRLAKCRGGCVMMPPAEL